MNDPPKEPPDHVGSKTGSKSVHEHPISGNSSLSTSSDAILDSKKKKKMARNQKRKVGEDFSPADKRRMSVDDTGLVGLALLMDGMERFGEQPTFSVVAGKKKQKTEDSSTSESSGTGTGTGTGTDASAAATPSTTEAAKKTAVSWLSTTEKYTFTIHKFILHVLVHELQPNLYETLEANLKTTPAIMSFKRYSCIPYTIPRGLTEWLSDSLLPS